MASMPPLPTVTADATGVWCQDDPDRRWGIRWEEITRVKVGKFNVVDEVDTIVELDFECGEWHEVNGAFPGFDDAMNRICSRLGCSADWEERIAELKPGQQAIVLWLREEKEESV